MLTTQLQPLPWQIDNWKSFHLANRAERMAHAILLTGPDGIGLEYFSKCLTAGLLCENTDENSLACGDCQSCHLINGESHPDLFMVEPEETGKQIKVDTVRKFIDSIHLKSQYGRYKIAVITPAESMNRNAANSLLKTLEEPPEYALLLLLSHRPNLLPITIRSRCQQIRFNPVFDDETVHWVGQHLPAELAADESAKHLLTQAGGAPLAIEAMLESSVLEYQTKLLEDLFSLKGMQEDPIKVAERWKTYDASQVFLWLSQLFADMVRLKVLGQPVRISDTKLIGRLQELIKQLELRELSGFYHLLLENYSLSTGAISYNAQGLLEDVIIFWQNLNDKQQN